MCDVNSLFGEKGLTLAAEYTVSSARLCTCNAVGRSCEAFDDRDEVDDVADDMRPTRDLPNIISVSSDCLAF